MIKKIFKISLFFLILGIFILPNFVLAREECGEGEYSLERPIFGLGCAEGPANYIVGLYPYALGLGVFAAAFMIVYTGIIYSTARDDVSKKTEMKKKIYAALGGLGLILGVILALNIINPDLADPEKWQEGITIKEIPKVEEGLTSLCYPEGSAFQICMSSEKCKKNPRACSILTGEYREFCLADTKTGEVICELLPVYGGDCGTIKNSLEECRFING
jgi:hypothetical protein